MHFQGLLTAYILFEKSFRAHKKTIIELQMLVYYIDIHIQGPTSTFVFSKFQNALNEAKWKSDVVHNPTLIDETYTVCLITCANLRSFFFGIFTRKVALLVQTYDF